MEPKIHKLERSGFELWGVSVGAKLVGSYWTENAARTRIAELLRGATTASESTLSRRPVASQSASTLSEAVDAATLIASILDEMRARRNAPLPTISVNYESWKAKSSIAKLLDGDGNEEWEARERAEREAEAAYWLGLAVENQTDRPVRAPLKLCRNFG